MDCQGVKRFERRKESLRSMGGPCLSPLGWKSASAMEGAEAGWCEGGKVPQKVERPEGDDGKDLDLAKLRRRSA